MTSGRDAGPEASGLPLLSGTFNGAVTFVAAFLVALLLSASSFSLTLLDTAIPGLPFLTRISLLFFGGHLVPAQLATGGGVETLNVATSPLGPGPMAPVIFGGLLVASGYSVAGDARSLRSAALSGGTLVLAYLPLVVLLATGAGYRGSTTSTLGGTESFALSVPIARAVLLAGVVFPVAFGALGGALAGRFGSAGAERPAPERSTDPGRRER